MEETRQWKFKIVRSPDYKTIYSTGVFGSVSPGEGRMIFYIDRPIPVMKDTPIGAMEVGEFERELQIEIRMSLQQWISMADWMQRHILELKKKGIIAATDVEKGE
jgi:hypothetical protein